MSTTVVFGDNTGDDVSGGILALKIKSNNPDAYSTFDCEVFQWNVGDVGNSIIAFTSLAGGAIPSGSTVTSASLILTVVGGALVGNPAYQVGAYQILRDYTSLMGVSWNSYEVGLPWTTPGALGAGDITLTAAGNELCPLSTPGLTFTITGAGLAALVQDWLDGTAANYGVLLFRNDIPYPPTGPVEESRIFGSGNADDGSRPRLSVTYTTDINLSATAAASAAATATTQLTNTSAATATAAAAASATTQEISAAAALAAASAAGTAATQNTVSAAATQAATAAATATTSLSQSAAALAAATAGATAFLTGFVYNVSASDAASAGDSATDTGAFHVAATDAANAAGTASPTGIFSVDATEAAHATATASSAKSGGGADQEQLDALEVRVAALETAKTFYIGGPDYPDDRAEVYNTRERRRKAVEQQNAWILDMVRQVVGAKNDKG